MKEETLTDQQIENWRRVMAIHGFGTFAFLCPKEIVIEYWKTFRGIMRLKQIVESSPEAKPAIKKRSAPKKCPPHGNTITGGKGTYCLDCENYV